jgi:hypothetical protein
MPEFEIRGMSRWWQVYQDGKPLPRVYSGHSLATAALKGIEKRLNMSKAPQRPCLRRKRSFASLGAHNRMCDHCRRTHF